MAQCEICSKSPQFGHSVSHSHRSTNRQFKPNVQRRKVAVGGRLRRMHICSRCLRTLDKSA